MISIEATMDDTKDNPPKSNPAPVKRAKALLLFIRDKATKSLPTNQSTLYYRTMTPALALPNANRDYLAPLYARALMPIRYRFIHPSPSRVATVFRATQDPLYGVPGLIHFMDARTAWIDDICTKCLKEEGFTQVVVVAAGFDSRSTRLYQRGSKFFEIDLPHVSKIKHKLTKKLFHSNCTSKPVRRTSVTNDSMVSNTSATTTTTDDDGAADPSNTHTPPPSSTYPTTTASPPSPPPLPVYIPANLSTTTIEAAMATVDTFSTTERTLFIIEGLLYYLEQGDIESLFAGINKVAGPGSVVCFDFMHADAISGEKTYAGFENLKTLCSIKGEVFKKGFTPQAREVETFLNKSGFVLEKLMLPKDAVDEYLGHLEWNDEENPPICPYFSYVKAVLGPV